VRVRRNLVVILALPDSRCRSRVRKGESKIYIMKKVFKFFLFMIFVFRGVSFATGGEGNWRTAPTLANLFRHFQILLIKNLTVRNNLIILWNTYSKCWQVIFQM
jgi:hypothetical protein